MLIFLQFSIGTKDVVTSSRHQPFCFHNFVFLLNCLFVLYNAHRISVCVISVNKSHEILLKVRRLASFFFDDDAYAFTSTRSNFFPRRRKGFDFDDESTFFPRRRTLAWSIQFGTNSLSLFHTHTYTHKSLYLTPRTYEPRPNCSDSVSLNRNLGYIQRWTFFAD